MEFTKKVTDFKDGSVYENEKGELFKLERGAYYKASGVDGTFEVTEDIKVSDKFKFTTKSPKRNLEMIYQDYLTNNLASARENNFRLLIKTLVEEVADLRKIVGNKKKTKKD